MPENNRCGFLAKVKMSAFQERPPMPFQYVKHEPLSLKTNPEFSEVWLHETIAKDPAILGLGELDVLVREKVQ